MTEPEKPTPPKAEKRKWPRRLAIAFAGLLLFAIVFHQPILIVLLRTAAIRFALRENVRLEMELGGDVFSSLEVRKLRATPQGPSPVERIEIESAEVHYSLWRFWRRGLSELLSSYHLRNAFIEISPVKATETQKNELANLLRAILEQPALFSDKVRIENFNLAVHIPEGTFLVAGLDAFLDPTETGYVRAEEIAVPGLNGWRDVEARATYAGRHLVARDFALGPDVAVKRVELDSSRRGKGVNYLSFEGKLLGADVGLFLWRRSDASGPDSMQLTASVQNLSLEELGRYFRWKTPLSGRVNNAWAELNGDPDDPSTWNGNSTLDAGPVTIDGVSLGAVTGTVNIVNGVARLKGALVNGPNRLDLSSEYRLPKTFDALFDEGIEAALALDAPKLPLLYPPFSQGSLRGHGTLRVRRSQLDLALDQAEAAGVEGAVRGTPLRIAEGKASLGVHYLLRERPPGTPWFDGLSGRVNASGRGMRLGEFLFDHASLAARADQGELIVDSAEFQSGANRGRFSGRLRLPEDWRKFSWKTLEASLRFDLAIPSLAAFVARHGPDGLSSLDGAVAASGEIRRSGGKTRGFGRLEAADLCYEGFAARRLSVEVPLEDNAAVIKTFLLDLNGRDQVAGSGSIRLSPPFAYEGRLTGSVQDLSVFESLVGTPLGGSLVIDWHGAGQLRPWRHSGEGRLVMHEGRVGGVGAIEAEIAGTYSPEAVEIPLFRIQSDKGSAEAVARLREQRLLIEPLRLEARRGGTVTGRIALPLDLRTPERPETIFPAQGAIDAQLTLQEVSLATLLRPPEEIAETAYRKNVLPPIAQAPAAEHLGGVEGKLNAVLAATGTVASPDVTLKLALRDLRLRTAAGVPPIALDATLRYQGETLALTGQARLPDAGPLQFAATMPLDIRQTIERRGLDPDTPFEGFARLSATPASALARFAPAVRYVEGQFSLDASASGTIAQPVFSGGVRLSLPALRFHNENLPGIDRLQADLRFSGNQLVIRQFSGSAAGGPFSLGGRVVFESLTSPVLDLAFRSERTLLVRNDAVVIRADSDIRITGPFASADVTGRVGINRSRFFREIEILPIGLPGRPAAKPAAAPPSAPSINVAPFRDWKFNVAIRTVEPFLIRSNLANGRALADLRLGGTGLAPTLEGTARLENFTASLPFSRLEVVTGYLYFTQDNPFNPTLDIHGTSRIRDYNIHVYIYGTAAEPQTLFTAEPTLAQEEIIALLATGATTQEVSQNSEVLAGRAGFLLLQDLYHKIFKRRRPPPPAAAGQQQVLDRFHLDVGTVDPRTGRQEVGGRFTLSKQFELAAGVDLEGDVRVQLRYLLRFR